MRSGKVRATEFRHVEICHLQVKEKGWKEWKECIADVHSWKECIAEDMRKMNLRK